MCSVLISEVNSGKIAISFWNSKQICPVDLCQERRVMLYCGNTTRPAPLMTHGQEEAALRLSPPSPAEISFCLHHCTHVHTSSNVSSLDIIRHNAETPVLYKQNKTPWYHTALSILAITSAQPDSYANMTRVMLIGYILLNRICYSSLILCSFNSQMSLLQ